MIIAKIFQRICKPAFFLSQMILIVALGCGPAPTEFKVIDITLASVPTPTIQLQPTETQIPLPSLTLTPFVPKTVIKIVSHVPLSGDQADPGRDIMQGTQLAVQQLSGPLSEFSYEVELVTYDDQNLVETALINAKQVVADPEILCGIGHYDSDITIAASNIYHQAGLAFIAPSATGPLLTGQSFLEINRVIGRTDRQGSVAAKFAKDQGWTSVYIVSQKSGDSLRNSEYFRSESGRLGIKRLGSVIFNLNAENMDRFVGPIVTARPDVVYISSSARQAIPFLIKLRAAGYTGAFLGTERLGSRSLMNDAGQPFLEGGVFYTILSPVAQYYSDAAQFIQDFHDLYGTHPKSFAARAYDATGICLKAIEEASQAKGGELPTRAEVAKAIRDLKDYKGITGTYNFNNHGDPDPMQYYVYQVVSTDTANWDRNPIVAAYEITAP
jgi:branched-chain amino acid transport system substrate-binding protein